MKKARLMCYCAVLIAYTISCNSPATNNKADEPIAQQADTIRQVADTAHTAPVTGSVQPAPVAKVIDTLTLTRNSDIHIIQMEKTAWEDSADSYFSRCAKWKLDANQVIDILKNSPQMGAHILHYAFSQLHCSMEGTVAIDNKEYKFEVNAGSYVILRNNDTTYYLDADRKPLRKYFLEESDHGQ
ncbi:hypothetical protein F0L74_20440 [Chitinophaga agrisoli]|uniref:Lipoprotein n=1 Tax=Chitinophaga agrisoli TaxID=2607653 RepID=A0A5B2VI61_9BACT|nr:hypothetical protein [Chitinophaga agrisoli]KAA2238595.1 hypothetical protein F0L74_20440 [Chitinophaga agrisoli]